MLITQDDEGRVHLDVATKYWVHPDRIPRAYYYCNYCYYYFWMKLKMYSHLHSLIPCYSWRIVSGTIAIATSRSLDPANATRSLFAQPLTHSFLCYSRFYHSRDCCCYCCYYSYILNNFNTQILLILINILTTISSGRTLDSITKIIG